VPHASHYWTEGLAVHNFGRMIPVETLHCLTGNIPWDNTIADFAAAVAGSAIRKFWPEVPRSLEAQPAWLILARRIVAAQPAVGWTYLEPFEAGL
jgi:hypothetical protein